MPYTTEALKQRTEDLQKFSIWFKSVKTLYDNIDGEVAYAKERAMQNIANSMCDIEEGKTLGDKYTYKFAQEFIAIAKKGKEAALALKNLRWTVKTPALIKAWEEDHVEKHFLGLIDNLFAVWDERVDKFNKVCNASSIEEIEDLVPRFLEQSIEKYLKAWQDPSEDIEPCDDVSCERHGLNLHRCTIMFMWFVETIRSEGGPEIIKKLMKKHDIDTDEFVKVFPDPPAAVEPTEEEKELASRIAAVDAAAAALKMHKYSGKYQRAYAAARAHLDELIQ
tara:strand:- start:3487 stop:4323 length:837 start_codon:yes stop_codon:yes gene_type:complete